MPAPEATAAPQQPQPVTPEQLLLLAAMNGMGGGHAPGFWGKGGGYVQGPNLVGEAFGLSNGKVFAQR